MTRKKRFVLNTFFSLFYQLITIIGGFILPRNMLIFFGSSTNGMVSSITQFLGFISFMQLGIGTVVQASWYKPLSEQNRDEISKIYVSAERFFRRIALIFLFYTIAIAIAYPFFAEVNENHIFVMALVFAISFSLFAQYFWGITNSLLLQSDQRAYITQILASIVTILNVTIGVLLIHKGKNILIVKLVSAVVMLIGPVGLNIYVKRRYKINKKIQFYEEPIKQKWNGFAQHISAVVVDNTDIIVLTLFSSLNNVSIYYVYYIVVNAIKTLLISLTSGIQSLFGDMIAKGEKILLNRAFNNFEMIFSFSTTLLYSTTMCLIVPFVSVYTKGINDTQYSAPLFSFLITAAYAMYCYRTTYYVLIKSAGHFKETQVSAVIEAVLNIVISVVSVIKWGLVGVALGTFVAVCYRTFYCVWYLSRNIIQREVLQFLINFALNICIFVISFLVTRRLSLTSLTFYSWVIMAIKSSAICLGICVVGYIIVYRRKLRGVKEFVQSTLIKKNVN